MGKACGANGGKFKDLQGLCGNVRRKNTMF